MLNFFLFFSKISQILPEFAEFSPNLTKLFGDFSKMQHLNFSKKFERVGASPKFPRSFPDVLQFGGQPTPPTSMRPFLAHAAPRHGLASRPLSATWSSGFSPIRRRRTATLSSKSPISTYSTVTNSRSSQFLFPLRRCASSVSRHLQIRILFEK